MRRWESPQSHQRARHGEAIAGGELDQLLGRVRVDDAPARVDHGTLGGSECLCGLADLLLVALERRLIAGQTHIGDRLIGNLGSRKILRDVDQHRARATAARQEERLVDRPWDFQGILDHEGVLDDRHRDADRVGLLEAVGAEQLGAHLTRDEHDRHGVHHRVADRGDQVGRARAAGGKRHTHLACGLRVALSRMPTAGLVAHQDVAQTTVDERIVGREVGATG